eukprot:GHVP01053215.1.p1 GENE.GHVP01053215.1~~GHVP01053215.1.p1  ORF type:complete len:164 (-),score=30.28 GHVP01053215.1:205-696(-)
MTTISTIDGFYIVEGELVDNTNTSETLKGTLSKESVIKGLSSASFKNSVIEYQYWIKKIRKNVNFKDLKNSVDWFSYFEKELSASNVKEGLEHAFNIVKINDETYRCFINNIQQEKGVSRDVIDENGIIKLTKEVIEAEKGKHKALNLKIAPAKKTNQPNSVD